jgi:hypothetical protein
VKILLDMDGVLCDFYTGVCRLFDKPAYPFTWKPNNWDWYGEWGATTGDLAPHMDRDFYADLGWTADGPDILERAIRMVGVSSVFLLTSPWDTPGCADGKRAWVAKHVPAFLPRLMIGSPKELCSRPDACLIDDSEPNCRKFATVFNGGHAVLLPRPWNIRHDESCFTTGRVLDMGGFWCGYTDGRPASMDAFLCGKAARGVG